MVGVMRFASSHCLAAQLQGRPGSPGGVAKLHRCTKAGLCRLLWSAER